MKENLNISLIQTNLHWEDRAKNLLSFAGIISSIQGSDIIVLPETFTTGFSMNKSVAELDGVTLKWMKEMASKTGSAIAGSYFVNDEGKCYNRFHFVEPDGHVTIYNKKHLFRLTNEQDVFSAGEEQVIVNYQGWKISLMVCYDLRFAVWMRRSAQNDYDLVVLVANWPERRSYAWNQLLIARAIENQSYVLATNRVGKDGADVLYGGGSMAIDAMGKVLAHGKPFTEEVVKVILNYSGLQTIRKNLPFYQDRDLFKLS